MILTPDLGKTVTLSFKDIKTGAIRLEVWESVNINGSNVYKSPAGRYYTKGIIGWMDVTHLV